MTIYKFETYLLANKDILTNINKFVEYKFISMEFGIWSIL